MLIQGLADPRMMPGATTETALDERSKQIRPHGTLGDADMLRHARR